MPNNCLPRIDKKNLVDGFKYRVFFACDGHIIHVQSESLSNEKLAYFFRSKTECKQFFRQLTWPASVAVFDTSRIRYLGGKDPPVTLRSLLILRKEHPSDLSPTITFTLRLERQHRTFTHRVRDFLPQAEATDEKYPELTLRFSSKRGPLGLSRRSNRRVEVMYRGLLPEKIDIHRDALVVQFPGVGGGSAIHLIMVSIPPLMDCQLTTRGKKSSGISSTRATKCTYYHQKILRLYFQPYRLGT